MRLGEEGRTVLVARHEPVLRDAGVVDRTIVMKDRELAAAGIAR